MLAKFYSVWQKLSDLLQKGLFKNQNKKASPSKNLVTYEIEKG